MQVLNVDQRGKDTVVVVDEHKIVWLLEVERNDTHGECCIHTAGPLLWCTLSKVENLRKYVFFFFSNGRTHRQEKERPTNVAKLLL